MADMADLEPSFAHNADAAAYYDPELVPELWEERLLNDGSRHQIYKRYFAAEQLADEIYGETLMDGTWFLAARASLPDRS